MLHTLAEEFRRAFNVVCYYMGDLLTVVMPFVILGLLIWVFVEFSKL